MNCKNIAAHVVTEESTAEEIAAGLAILVMRYCFFMQNEQVKEAGEEFVHLFNLAQNNQDRLMPFIIKHTNCPDCRAKLQMGLRSHN